MSKKKSYSIETKLKAVELKQNGYSNAYIMNELQIKNKTQIQTWCRWENKERSIGFINQWINSMLIKKA